MRCIHNNEPNQTLPKRRSPDSLRDAEIRDAQRNRQQPPGSGARRHRTRAAERERIRHVLVPRRGRVRSPHSGATMPTGMSETVPASDRLRRVRPFPRRARRTLASGLRHPPRGDPAGAGTHRAVPSRFHRAGPERLESGPSSRFRPPARCSSVSSRSRPCASPRAYVTAQPTPRSDLMALVHLSLRNGGS